MNRTKEPEVQQTGNWNAGRRKQDPPPGAAVADSPGIPEPTSHAGWTSPGEWMARESHTTLDLLGGIELATLSVKRA